MILTVELLVKGVLERIDEVIGRVGVSSDPGAAVQRP